MKPLKMHASFDEQIEKMKSRGLIVQDEERARAILQNTNYYRLSGYLYSFRVRGTEQYKEGTSLAQIKRIYDFDRRFTRILMYALEDIEESLKTRISYSITSIYPQDPLIYKNPAIYREDTAFKKFLNLFNRSVSDNRKLPFVKHHLAKYNGELPMWVAVELLTMGNLHAMYDNLIGSLQKAIAKTYGTGSQQLSNWIKNLTFTRNHLAHYMRVYDFDFGRTPVHCSGHHTHTTTTNMIFDQLYIMSFMYSDSTEWNNYIIPAICDIFREYQDVVELKKLGFPDNWISILSV